MNPEPRLHYSIGFDVMALVIQRIAKMAYDEFLELTALRAAWHGSTGIPGESKGCPAPDYQLRRNRARGDNCRAEAETRP